VFDNGATSADVLKLPSGATHRYLLALLLWILTIGSEVVVGDAVSAFVGFGVGLGEGAGVGLGERGSGEAVGDSVSASVGLGVGLGEATQLGVVPNWHCPLASHVSAPFSQTPSSHSASCAQLLVRNLM